MDFVFNANEAETLIIMIVVGKYNAKMLEAYAVEEILSRFFSKNAALEKCIHYMYSCENNELS